MIELLARSPCPARSPAIDNLLPSRVPPLGPRESGKVPPGDATAAYRRRAEGRPRQFAEHLTHTGPA